MTKSITHMVADRSVIGNSDLRISYGVGHGCGEGSDSHYIGGSMGDGSGSGDSHSIINNTDYSGRGEAYDCTN